MMLHMLKPKDIPAQIEKPLWVDQLMKRKPQYMNIHPLQFWALIQENLRWLKLLFQVQK